MDNFAATLSLDLQQLADRLGQFIDLGGLQFAGEGSGRIDWKRTPQQQFDAGGQLQLRGFQWSLPNRPPWREETVTLEASAKGQTDLGANTRIDAAALSVKAKSDRLDVRLAAPVANLSGSGAWPMIVQMQGQLQDWPPRLAAWLPMNNCRLGGGYVLSVTVQPSAGVVHGNATVELTNLTVIDAAGQQFREPTIRLAAQGEYDSKSQVLQLGQCQLTSSAVAAGAAGCISPVGGENNAQFQGQFNYDLQRLSDLFRPYLGPNVRVVGRGASQAWYRGPLDFKSGSAAAAIRWDGANLYGFPLGPGEIKATLANGMLQIEPLDLAVNQGRIHLAPQVQLKPDPMELRLPKGPLAQHIQVDAATCGSMLKFIAPALAGVTTAQGSFSIELDDCRVPLTDPAKADVSGRLIVHAMTIGSSPLTHELAVFQGRESAAQMRPESVVPFRLTQGRVYHDNLELIFPDITIRSRGSVGLDETLDVLVQMPVPAKWLAGNAVAAQAMRSQTISAPLRGTLGKPQLDPKAMQELTGQFLQKAAGNVIEGELNRFFGPKK